MHHCRPIGHLRPQSLGVEQRLHHAAYMNDRIEDGTWLYPFKSTFMVIFRIPSHQKHMSERRCPPKISLSSIYVGLPTFNDLVGEVDMNTRWIFPRPK